MWSLAGHSAQVLSVAFSPEGERIVSGSADKTVKIWSAKTGAEVSELMRERRGWLCDADFVCMRFPEFVSGIDLTRGCIVGMHADGSLKLGQLSRVLPGGRADRQRVR